MVRKARNGIVYPYRVERRKRLSDGTVKIYASYEFKIDGKAYSRKKYADANKRLTELLQERPDSAAPTTALSRSGHTPNNGSNAANATRTRKRSPTIGPSSASTCSHTTGRNWRT